MMTDEREVRQTMAAGLVSAAAKDDRIVVLDADLMSCHSTKCFLEAYPERFINVFATRRCYDQIFISVAYSKLPVKIVGSDPGVMAEANGGTHMPFEDMSVMRAIPHMVCFEPTDATMLEKALPEIIDYPGAVYIRMFRKKAEKIYDDSLEFKLGKAVTLKDGGDVTLIASGIMVARALKAADELKEAGIDARVLNIHTWKPIDEDAIVSAAKGTGAIVTCENHTTAGGLGSAVAEVAAEKCPVPMEFVGVKNSFGEVGKEAYLSEKFGLTVSDIVAAAKRAVARK